MQICHVRACTGGHWSSTSSFPRNLKCNPLPGLQRNPTPGHNLWTKSRFFEAVSPLCTFTACCFLEIGKTRKGEKSTWRRRDNAVKTRLDFTLGPEKPQLHHGGESRAAKRQSSTVPWTGRSGDGGFSWKIFQLKSHLPAVQRQETGGCPGCWKS